MKHSFNFSYLKQHCFQSVQTLMEVKCEKFVMGKRLEYKLLVMSQKDELAPNVMAMVQSFNRLALLVPTEILEEATPQARSKIITSFIQVRKFRFHSQFTVFHSHVRLNLVLIPIPEEESNLIGHFDLKFTKCQCHRIEIHLQWSASKHFAEVYTFTGACLTLWWYATTTTQSNLVQ